jgi:hypothetical protein
VKLTKLEERLAMRALLHRWSVGNEWVDVGVKAFPEILDALSGALDDLDEAEKEIGWLREIAIYHEHICKPRLGGLPDPRLADE